MKKVLRQVKNRESAQVSRLRRRDHIEAVEAELEHEKRVSSRWHEYASALQGLLRTHGIAVPAEPEIPVFVPPEPSELTVAGRRGLVRPLRTAGICLMVVVLSVGLFFKAVNRMDAGAQRHVNATAAPAAPATTPVDSPAAATALVPPTPSVSTPAAPGRVLRNGQDPTASEAGAASPARPADLGFGSSSRSSGSGSGSSGSNASSGARTAELVPESAYLSFDTEREDSSLALVVPAAKPGAADSALVPRKTCPVMHYTTKALFGHAQPRVADHSWALDNSTSYILVNDATEFVPRSAAADGLPLRTEPVIGLLLPAASLNLSNCEPGDVVELVCGVRDANVVPRSVFAHSLH